MSTTDTLARTRQAFDAACAKDPTDVHESWYRFAGRPVRIRVAGSALADHAHAAFEHLQDKAAAGEEPTLRIDMWDRTHTRVGCPGLALIPESTWGIDAGLMTLYRGGDIVRYERPQSVSCLDGPAGQILSCREDGDKLALYERSKPFPYLLARWYLLQGLQPVHAGLVARDGEGILFVGDSGAGKTTCTLTSTLAGFAYLGDDTVALSGSGGRWTGHSIYNGARIDPGHLARFPDLRQHAAAPVCEWDEKCLALMSRVHGVQVAQRTSIAAIVAPRVVGHGPTRSRRIRGARCLGAFARSSLGVPLGAGAEGFFRLAELLSSVPVYQLDIGKDVGEIPEHVEKVLQAVLSREAS